MLYRLSYRGIGVAAHAMPIAKRLAACKDENALSVTRVNRYPLIALRHIG